MRYLLIAIALICPALADKQPVVIDKNAPSSPISETEPAPPVNAPLPAGYVELTPEEKAINRYRAGIKHKVDPKYNDWRAYFLTLRKTWRYCYAWPDAGPREVRLMRAAFVYWDWGFYAWGSAHLIPLPPNVEVFQPTKGAGTLPSTSPSTKIETS